MAEGAAAGVVSQVRNPVARQNGQAVGVTPFHFDLGALVAAGALGFKGRACGRF